MVRRRSFQELRAPGVLVWAALLGIAVAGVTSAFEHLTLDVVASSMTELPLWQRALAPAAGLVGAHLALRVLTNGASPATSDEYVRAFHERTPSLPAPTVVGRLVASCLTIGLGGAVGLEGPAIYTGASMGLGLQHRIRRLLTKEDARVLLTAGAAAGIAAVFKTPATGVVFALETPYRDDVARRALLPSLIASATAYLTVVAVDGTRAVVPRFGATVELDAPTVAGVVLLGVLTGLVSRAFSRAVEWAKDVAATGPLLPRLLVGGAALAGLAFATEALLDAPLSLGSGYDAIGWARSDDLGIRLVLVLLIARMVASVVTVAAGGAGGLFIPVAAHGVLLGSALGTILGEEGGGIYPTIGLAAALGAAFRTPLAAVMFVAETGIGQAEVIPGLVAAAVAIVAAGSTSVSGHQRRERQGHLERRLGMPITAALAADVMTVPPDATIDEFVHVHITGRRQRVVPVVDGDRYLGLCGVEEVARVPRDHWETTAVADAMRTDLPVGRPAWTLRDATAAMTQAGVDLLAVTDASGAFVGTVDASEIVKLGEILDETGG